MNIQLVESLVQIIQSLSLEEQKLLKSQLEQIEEKKDNWEEVLEEIEASKQKDLSVRQGKKIELSITEIIHQMREERDQQLLETWQS
ncbi:MULTISPECIES: hypothetical protein [Synechocystis]|uniref:Uncharacterized protein n=1 Tax=Synechocystis salina LEGE 00031 TaxID=1828736 RepID=A0ABR9VSG6_9SYNC|nr:MULTISPECIES: hypothetical protein [Synechocystis]MBE9193911.1 hypothetical protein [Synechocystis sp. LEGE 06083]MBE9240836.1 hypothetical protein [Synechocystis salina LEGE 00041]MBE9254296.1 hypothetical protein [Synechocystis salina LEGE 00031]